MFRVVSVLSVFLHVKLVVEYFPSKKRLTLRGRSQVKYLRCGGGRSRLWCLLSQMAFADVRSSAYAGT